MIPILFDRITEGVVPTNYGLGALTDAIKCEVPEGLNSSYELSLEYAADGIHAADIQPGRFIIAKPNYTDEPQIFRIYKVGKTIKGKFSVYAQHISYDLSGKVITTGSASSAPEACVLLEAQAGAFTINTDKTTVGAFNIDAPASVRSFFGGKAGSLLDVYGGEWYFNNYTATLKASRGIDRGVTIRYGKNLTDLSQVLDMSNLVTGVIPYYIDPNGVKTVGARVDTGLEFDVPRDIALDFSTDVDPESAVPITTQLGTLAARYISNNNLIAVSNAITLDFVQMQGLTERVDLGDTVKIYFEPLGLAVKAKCIKTVWDVLRERYVKTSFGDTRANITDTIANNVKSIERAASRDYVNESSQLITGNLGGYVILDDSDGDGKPDQILIMDTDSKETASQVWRFNRGGLGYGTSYAGPFDDIALTADGKINASRIVTGTLTANIIKAGVLSDSQGNSSINMTTGAATMYQFRARDKMSLINNSNATKAEFDINVNGNTYLRMRSASSSTDLIKMWAQDSNGAGVLNLCKSNGNAIVEAGQTGDGYGGGLGIRNSSNVVVGELITNAYGGAVFLKNNSGGSVCELNAAPAGDGVLILRDSSNNATVYGFAQSGDLVCVTLYQTSSRKVKENIEPMDDADKLLELEAVKFDYKNKALGTDKRGFIAEDVAAVLPGLVKPETDTTTASLDYIQMVPYLQAIAKRHDAEIKDLKAQIKALTDKINKLEG